VQCFVSLIAQLLSRFLKRSDIPLIHTTDLGHLYSFHRVRKGDLKVKYTQNSGRIFYSRLKCKKQCSEWEKRKIWVASKSERSDRPARMQCRQHYAPEIVRDALPAALWNKIGRLPATTDLSMPCGNTTD